MPQVLGKVVCQRAGQIGVVVRHDQDAGAHLADVGIGEAEQQTRREHAPVGHQVAQRFVRLPAGRAAGALPFNVDCQRRISRGLGRPALALQHAGNQPRGFDPPDALVEMRVRAIRHQGVGGPNHGLGQVGVQVEGTDDRHAGAHAQTQLAEPCAVHVRCVLGDAGAMRGDEQAVEFAGQL